MKLNLALYVVRELCVEVDDDLYREILTLRTRGITLRELILKGVEYFKSISHKFEPIPRFSIRECGEVRPYEYCWPPCRSSDDVEAFEKAQCYEIVLGSRRYRFYIAYGYRWAFGDNRRRVVVFKIGARGRVSGVLVEFAGSDDYEITKNVVSLLKRPDRKYMKLEELDLYPEYLRIGNHIVNHASVICRGRHGYAALCTREDNVELILYHAIVQGKWRKML